MSQPPEDAEVWNGLRALRDCSVIRARTFGEPYATLRSIRLASSMQAPNRRGYHDFRLTELGRRWALKLKPYP